MKPPSTASQPSSGTYLIPAGRAQAEIRERNSRFLALLSPVADEKAASSVLEATRIEHPGATHHCWAWRLGAEGRERSSDDGEPAGTAGVPILRVLRGETLSDVLVVVVRWFGGTKLGKGGLARAYAGACRAAVEEARVVRRIETRRLAVSLPYERLGAVKRLADRGGCRLLSEDYGKQVGVVLEVELPAYGAICSALADLGQGVEVERLRDDDASGAVGWLVDS